MRQLIAGLILGSALTASIGLAGSLYDSKGQVQAPSGSVQQFDYFRQRQLFLDVAAQRRMAEETRTQKPCGR